jgi:two-component system sensor histidine kinase/response regulator
MTNANLTLVFALVLSLLSLVAGMTWRLRQLRLALAAQQGRFEHELHERTREVHALNAELIRRAEEAEAATRAKSAFLASMSHEIRSPMNAILGMAYLMRRAGANRRQTHQLDRIDQAARHLLAVVGDVLDLSKIEAGKLVLETHDFRLADLIESVVSVVGDSLRSKDVVLKVELKGVPPYLRGDETRLRQALLNYLSNAAKFTESGCVSLCGWVEAREADGLRLRFEVTDTGIGISAECLQRLFAPFEQANEAAAGCYGGTGLGLSITRRIVEVMGGRVGAESVQGSGSTFWLTVRLQEGAEMPPHPPDDLAVEEILLRHFHGTRVLVVEDEPVNQDVALELLRAVGLEPDLAANGQQAVEMGATGPYALILMDMQLPVMDGVEASRLLRAAGCTAPVLAMTGNALAEDRTRCMEAGMDDFISKPVDPEVLFRAVLRCLSGRHTP